MAKLILMAPWKSGSRIRFQHVNNSIVICLQSHDSMNAMSSHMDDAWHASRPTARPKINEIHININVNACVHARVLTRVALRHMHKARTIRKPSPRDTRQFIFSFMWFYANLAFPSRGRDVRYGWSLLLICIGRDHSHPRMCRTRPYYWLMCACSSSQCICMHAMRMNVIWDGLGRDKYSLTGILTHTQPWRNPSTKATDRIRRASCIFLHASMRATKPSRNE